MSWRIPSTASGFSHKTSKPVTTLTHRLALLDVLRCALALLIFMFHSNMHFGCDYGFLNKIVGQGAFAMTGFFLLSGYSLRIAYGEKDLIEKSALKGFYIKRALAILPMYYTYALLYILFLGDESLRENLLLFPIEGLGLQSTFSSLFGITHNGGTWFISCLLLGYLIYPFIQTVAKQLSVKQEAFLIVLLVGVDLWAVLVSKVFGTSWIYDNPFYRILEFSAGLLVADVNKRSDGRIVNILRSWGVLFGVSITMLVSIALIQYFCHIRDYMIWNWVVLPCFVIMLFSMGSKNVKWLEQSRLLRYASSLSYAFFLFQPFVWKAGRFIVRQTGYDHNWFRISFSFVLCTVISMLMYEIVQKRFVGYFKMRFSRK